MMQFETWNRETLINEIKIAMPIAYSKAIGNFMGLPMKPKLYSDIELHQKTDHTLRSLYVDLKQYDSDFREEYEENEEKKRFFNQPSTDADVDYWSKQAYWTIDEAIALLLGKDPRKVTWENVKTHLAKSPFAKKFNEIRELAHRYVHCKELFDTVFPGVFLAWAKRMKIEIPDQLLEAVTTVGIQICDWQTLFKQAEEIIKVKNQTIQSLTQQRDLLKSENTRLAELSQLELDPENENYPSELDAANIIYRSVLNNRDNTLSFKEQAKKNLDKDYPKFSQDAKERITVVINPDKQKLGGRRKQVS